MIDTLDLTVEQRFDDDANPLRRDGHKVVFAGSQTRAAGCLRQILLGLLLMMLLFQVVQKVLDDELTNRLKLYQLVNRVC